jgi:hypothetical protein
MSYLKIFLILALTSVVSLFSDYNDKIIPNSVVDQIEKEIANLKAIVIEINASVSSSPEVKKGLIEAVMKKNRFSDDISEIIIKQFLQKGISSTDPQLDKKLIYIHRMLEILYDIRNTADIKLIDEMEVTVTSFKALIEVKQDKRESRYRYIKGKKIWKKNDDIDT